MNSPIKKLQAKIIQLQKENSQLKTSFYEIINLAYQALNNPAKNPSNSNKEPNFSFFGSGGSKCFKNHQNEQLKECFFSFIKDFSQPAKKTQPTKENNRE